MSDETTADAVRRSRLRSIQRGMRNRARLARAAAVMLPKDSPAAAALRGKAWGYLESADMVEAVLRGGHVTAKWRDMERI